MSELFKKLGRIAAVVGVVTGIQAATPSSAQGIISTEPIGNNTHETTSHYEDFPKEYDNIQYLSSERLEDILGVKGKTQDEITAKLREFRKKVLLGENRISVLGLDVRDRAGKPILKTGIYYLQRFDIGFFLYDDTLNTGPSFNPNILPSILGKYWSPNEMLVALKNRTIKFESREKGSKILVLIRDTELRDSPQ